MSDLTAAKRESLIKQGLDILLTRAWLMQHRKDLSRDSFERLLDHENVDIIRIWKESLSKLLSQRLDSEDDNIAKSLRDFARNMKRQEEAVDLMIKRVVELKSRDDSGSATKQDYNDIFETEEDAAQD